MKRIVMVLVLALLISTIVFGGSYLEIGRNALLSMAMLIPGPYISKPITPPPVFPTQISQTLEVIYVLPVSGHFSATADFEDYNTCRAYYNSSFVSGAVGMRYTSDVMDSFLGPLKVFTGVNGGGLLLVGGTTLYPLVTADVGVSFKLTDMVNTFWDLKFYDSLWKQINFYPSLSGGVDFNF